VTRSVGLRVALLAVLALAPAGCDASLEPTATTAPVNAKAVDQGFVLETSIPKAIWAAREVIPVTTKFTWTGTDPQKTVWTFGGGPVTFDLRQLDGPLFQMGPVHTADCAPKSFARDVATPIPFQKNAAWDEKDPNASFYNQFASDPLLRLPTGRWELRIGVVGQLAECTQDGASLDLDLPPIILEVG
jgi:hypothetical protein